jgi:adenylate cyclase
MDCSRRHASVSPLPLTLVVEGADQPFCLEMVASQAYHGRRPSGLVMAGTAYDPRGTRLSTQPVSLWGDNAGVPVEDDIGRQVLLGTASDIQFGRRIFRRLPSQPRCKLCAAPFHGPFGPVMRIVGKRPWPATPNYCGSCFIQRVKHRSGAEIECTLLFADVRGSTELAEGMSPTEFRTLMDGFFQKAYTILVAHDGIVDKFVGDEVIGIFIPGLTGERHAERAISAGRALLAATGDRSSGAHLPIGVGVNTGVAYVGAMGAGDRVDFTAMGDPVNVAARLASAAGEGELLVTLAAADSAHIVDTQAEHRNLELKGKSEPIEVLVLH